MKSVAKSGLNKSSNKIMSVTMHLTTTCGACQGQAKSVKRDFSDKAWAALVTWREISKEAIDQPICGDCYLNFRDVLIDRAEDVAAMTIKSEQIAARKAETRLAYA